RDPPAELRERHAAARVDGHAFAHETNSLRGAGVPTIALQAEAALGVNHAMPGHGAAGGKSRQRVAPPSRMPRESGDARDTAVRRYATLWNSADHGVDPRVVAASLFTHATLDASAPRGSRRVASNFGRQARRSRMSAVTSASSAPTNSRRGGRTA